MSDEIKPLPRPFKRLIEAHETYEKLLGDEINDICGIALVHGWQSKRFEAGEKCRAEIKAATEQWQARAPINTETTPQPTVR